MRYVFILLISSFLFSCNLSQPKSTDNNSVFKNDSTPDLGKIAQMKLSHTGDYRKTLDQLDQGNLSSLDVAGTLFKNCIGDTLTRDSMFVVFNDFYNTVAGSYLENNEIVNTQLQNSPSPGTLNKVKTSLAAYGFSLSSSEGNFYLEPQTEYLLQNFGSALSPAYHEFLTIGSKEQHTRFAEDGTILIPADSLTSRIMTWENFMIRYPDFISIKMAQDQYAQYMSAFLAGMDNSRVFNPESNRLNDSSKVSFESFIVKNPESKSTEVVKAYLDLLKTTNFNYTDKVDSFLLEKVYH
ncbi:MAG: hypothetical protein NTY07_06295 [Bacteroidia bacterium]|nr:hypothetical protein [Bacteroidia bacterium]